MITIRLMGGMGNQMFQYAMARSLANRRNTRVNLDITPLLHRLPGRGYVFRTFDLDLYNIDADLSFMSKVGKYFNNTSFLFTRIRQRLLSRFFPHKYIIEKEYNLFDSRFLDSPDGCILDGFWQSYRYFADIEDTIRHDFEIKHEMNPDARVLAEKIKNTSSVCINIRRADYVTIQANTDSFGVMSMEYFNAGIELIKEKVATPFFFIFTDDIAWAQENFQDLENFMVIPENCYGDRYIDKFHLMTLCKHFIIPNSTYGWWAAWLAKNPEKIVVCPAQWLVDPEMNKRTVDLIPEGWIRI